MSTFLSIFKKIDIVIDDIEQIVEAPVEALVPASVPVFGLFDKIQQSIFMAEGIFSKPQMGLSKSTAVVQDFNDNLGMLQASLEAKGKILYYDPALLQKVVDAQVATNNAMLALQATFRITKLPA